MKSDTIHVAYEPDQNDQFLSPVWVAHFPQNKSRMTLFGRNQSLSLDRCLRAGLRACSCTLLWSIARFAICKFARQNIRTEASLFYPRRGKTSQGDSLVILEVVIATAHSEKFLHSC